MSQLYKRSSLHDALESWKQKIAIRSRNVQKALQPADELNDEDLKIADLGIREVITGSTLSQITSNKSIISTITKHRCCTYVNLQPQYCDQEKIDIKFNCVRAKCMVCLDLDPDLYPIRMMERPLSPNRRISTSLLNVKKASKSGCVTCKIIYGGYKQIKKELELQHSRSGISLSLCNLTIRLRVDGPMSIMLHDYLHMDGGYFASLEFFCREGE